MSFYQVSETGYRKPRLRTCPHPAMNWRALLRPSKSAMRPTRSLESTRASAAPKFASTPCGSSASVPVRRIREHRWVRKHLPADWRALRSVRQPTPFAFYFTNDICPRAGLWILDAQTNLGAEAVSAQCYSYFVSQAIHLVPVNPTVQAYATFAKIRRSTGRRRPRRNTQRLIRQREPLR
jgi:hypothetical protein